MCKSNGDTTTPRAPITAPARASPKTPKRLQQHGDHHYPNDDHLNSRPRRKQRCQPPAGDRDKSGGPGASASTRTGLGRSAPGVDTGPLALREAKEQGEELLEGLLSPGFAGFGATQLWVSDVGQLIADSSKMQVLEKLLIKLCERRDLVEDFQSNIEERVLKSAHRNSKSGHRRRRIRSLRTRHPPTKGHRAAYRTTRNTQ